MRRAAEQTAARWSREADELTAQCPDFDLGAALKDDRFCALLRAGIDVRTAWFALHAQALLETACLRAGRSAEQRVSEHIRARGLRPVENGLGSGGAGIVVRPDVSRMSRADRAGACRARGARRAREAEPVTRFAYICRDGRCVLRADGHADFCPGSDIVCAGASALMVRAGGCARHAQRAGRAADAQRRTRSHRSRRPDRCARGVYRGSDRSAAACRGLPRPRCGGHRPHPRTGGTQRQHSGGCCPAAVPGSGQQRKKET